MKKVLSLALTLALALTAFSGCSGSAPSQSAGKSSSPSASAGANASTGTSANSSAPSASTQGIDFPNGPLTLIVPYGEGGGKDIMARGFTPYLKDSLGVDIVVENRAGSSGAVGAQYVQSLEADGYTLYLGGESAETFQVMGLFDQGYDAWSPIIVLNRESPTLLVNPDSKFAGMKWDEIIAYIQANPGDVTFGTTGVGSVQWNWMKLLEQGYGVKLLDVAYESGTAALTALLGGHIDLYACGPSQCNSYVEAGTLIPICTLDKQPIEGFDCDCLSDYTDVFDPYLPYGSYVVMMAKAGIDSAVVDKLISAATEAFNTDKFQSFLVDTNKVVPVGLTGEEARDYVKRQQSTTCYLLYDAGELSVNPADFGIERIGG